MEVKPSEGGAAIRGSDTNVILMTPCLIIKCWTQPTDHKLMVDLEEKKQRKRLQVL